MPSRLLGLLVLIALAGAPAAPGAAPADVPAVDVRRVPNGGIQPDLAVGADGAIHLVYFAGPPMNGNVLYVKSRDGGVTFSAPLRVNSQEGSAIARGTVRGPQIAVARDGRVHVTWNGSDSALPRGLADPKTGRRGSPMLYARSSGQPATFEPQRNLMTHTYELDGGGALAVDDDGSVYVVWHGNEVKGGAGEAGRRVWVARSSDAGATFSTEAAAWSEPTGACGCCGMRVVAAGGTVRILYRSATAQLNRDIYALVSSDRGRSFQGTRLHEWDINACPMTSMSIATRGPKVVGAWETDGQVYFSDLAGPPAARGPVRGQGAERRKHPRLALDKAGQVLMVWTEGMHASHGGGLAWQVFDANGQPVGAPGARPGVPGLSLGVAAARPDAGFVIFY